MMKDLAAPAPPKTLRQLLAGQLVRRTDEAIADPRFAGTVTCVVDDPELGLQGRLLECPGRAGLGTDIVAALDDDPGYSRPICPRC